MILGDKGFFMLNNYYRVFYVELSKKINEGFSETSDRRRLLESSPVEAA